MPTFNILLAQDISHYGSVSVEGDTWQEAVASLTSSSWDECTEAGADHYEMRVVHVEAEDGGDIVAEDIAYSRWLVHSLTVIHRLTKIMDTCDVPDDTAAALVAYIDELRTMVRDPIFNKETDQ
jgi:hypothetical protein